MGMLVVSALWGASAAHAQTFYNLTVDHCTSGCGTSPFGTVELQPGTNSVLVTVSLLNGDQFVDSGLHAFTFDVGGTAAISGLTAGFTADALGSYHQDGFGDFPYAIECGTACGPGGSSPGGSTLSFTVTQSGLTVSSFVSNGSAFFTADILGTNGKTGPVGAIATTPEPTSMLLFGTGLVVFGGMLRLRNRKSGNSVAP
jgi:PEP-CTERM motif-containing protein